MNEQPRTEEGQKALPPTAAEMGRQAPKQTVREQLVEALEAEERAEDMGQHFDRAGGEAALFRVRQLREEAAKLRRLALARARAEPEEPCRHDRHRAKEDERTHARVEAQGGLAASC